MIICSNCGRKNEDGATFCADPACNTYLQWNGQERTAAIRVPVLPNSSQAPVADERQGVQLSLDREPIQIEAGGQAGLGVRIRNTGTIVDEFVIEVTGAPAAWSVVEPPSLSLFPGSDASARITFQPPRAPDTPAGPLPFRVRAYSKVNSSVSGVEAWMVTVGGFRTLSAELVPRTATSRWRTSHRFSVANTGNLPVSAVVDADDPDGKLYFKVTPPVLQLAANQEVAAAVRVRPRRWLWLGTPQRHRFEVRAQPEEDTERGDAGPAAPLKAEGTMVQVPLLPKWVLYAVAAAGAAAVAAVALLASDRSAPPPPSLTAPPGPTVITTTSPTGILPANPQPGAPVTAPANPPVTPPTNPGQVAPVQVPDVVGKSANTALGEIQDAGLKVKGAPPEASNEAAAGRVIRTVPAAGTELAKGSAVTVVSSSGPTPAFDMLAQADAARWSSGAGALPFPGSEGDNRGFALVWQNKTIEDGSTHARVLETHPQWVDDGFIQGDYQLPAPIIAGDRFTSDVGFRSSGIVGDVNFSVRVTDAQGRSVVARDMVVRATADGRLQQLDIDLSPYEGARTISLRVDARGTSAQDWAVWVDPKVEGRPAR
ncbi:MAG: PASTA domain-containing protein [Egibacteraceae bacterium]